MNDNPSPEEIAAAEAEAARVAAETTATTEETPEQIAEREAAEAAALAAASEEDDIPEDKFYGKLSKTSGDRIKTKEDLDKVLSFNENDYIKPKSDLIKKLNEFDGDAKTFFELSELDVDGMDKKDAIIKNMMIQKGYSKEDAEMLFEDKFGAAFHTDEDVEFDAKQKRVAELKMEEEFAGAKENLAKYKVDKLASFGEKQPTAEELASVQQEREEKWIKPMSATVDSIEKIESGITFKLPDEQEVTEAYTFATTDNETKELIKAIVVDPATFGEKFVAEFGKGKTLEEGIKNLGEAIYFLKHKDEFLSLAAKLGADRSLASHLEKVNPGSLKKETRTTVVAGQENQLSVEKGFVKELNERMMGGKKGA